MNKTETKKRLAWNQKTYLICNKKSNHVINLTLSRRQLKKKKSKIKIRIIISQALHIYSAVLSKQQPNQ
ncbi:hypothetical protein BpHYR1_037418 [Brachionus plicatilis]|uniref:Uncharacterized protein n=1 Tax=Brachionus plicatilis TaxID=10195 RepID=A0A3M7SQP9_BRAPC|nr:hypothetical protein BpHYR1_037418 [Brachionus plicatilis]